MTFERADRRIARLGHRLAAVAAAGTLAGLVAVPLAAAPSYAAPGDPDEAKQAFTIDDERVTESSGLAASTKHAGYFYTNNDSGDTARVFALDPRGNVVGTLVLGSAGHLDWEALASGPDERIWIGDIGDNEKLRGSVTLYRFREPESLGDQSVEWSRFRLEYPDGPHDAEALLVHPRTGRVYIVTKDPKGGAIYAAPPELVAGATAELTKVASAPAVVTDGVFAPDGSAIVLRTYADAQVLSWPDAKVVRKIPLTQQRQGESVAMSLDGEEIFVGSEGARSAVFSVPFTAGAPVGTSTPGQTPAPKPSTAKPTAPASDDAADTSAGADNGLFGGLPGGILLLVIVAAVLAGVAAFPVSRRKRPVRRRPPEDPTPGGLGGRGTSPYDDPREAWSATSGLDDHRRGEADLAVDDATSAEPGRNEAWPEPGRAGEARASEPWATPSAGDDTWAGNGVAPSGTAPADERPAGGRRRAAGPADPVPLPWEDADWHPNPDEPAPPRQEPGRSSRPVDQPVEPWAEPRRSEDWSVPADRSRTEDWSRTRDTQDWSRSDDRLDEWPPARGRTENASPPEEQWPPPAQWPPEEPRRSRGRRHAQDPATEEPRWPDEENTGGRRRSQESWTHDEPAYDNGTSDRPWHPVTDVPPPAAEPPAAPARRGRRIRSTEDVSPADQRPPSPRQTPRSEGDEEPPWAVPRSGEQSGWSGGEAGWSPAPPQEEPERPRRRRPLYRDEPE
ncbi:hypothetical protein [Actinopolymorpha pittospori]